MIEQAQSLSLSLSLAFSMFLFLVFPGSFLLALDDDATFSPSIEVDTIPGGGISRISPLSSNSVVFFMYRVPGKLSVHSTPFE